MRTLKNIINLSFLILGHLFPRFKNKIVFGAWNGKSYSDNPKFLFQYFFDHPEWQIVWIGNKQVQATLPALPSHASFAVRHSLKGMWHALTAGTWAFSHSTNDISIVAIWGRALLIDTSHGVGIKRSGKTSPRSTPSKHSTLIDDIWKRIFIHKIYIGLPSKIQGEITLKSYPGMFQTPILPFGSPAIDYILHNMNNPQLKYNLRDKFSRLFNIPERKKWIVYAPTFRHSVSSNFSFLSLSDTNMSKIRSILNEKDAIIIEKLHPNLLSTTTPTNVSLCPSSIKTIYSMTGRNAKLLEPHDLWLAADAIISDYSSCLVPFYMQNKPVIHFVYDLDFYANEDSGLLADIDKVKFGVIAKDFDSLCQVLENIESAKNQCGCIARQLTEYEDGNSCNKYKEFITLMHRIEAKSNNLTLSCM